LEQLDTFMGIIVPYANFALFIILAVVFFRSPARAAAKKKREAFEAQMREASRVKQEAEAKLLELQTRMNNMDREVAEMMDTAKKSAAIEADKIVSDAERLAQHLQSEAVRVANAEAEKARATLRDEIIAEAMVQVTKKLQSELSEKDHGALVKSRLGKLQELRAEG